MSWIKPVAALAALSTMASASLADFAIQSRRSDVWSFYSSAGLPELNHDEHTFSTALGPVALFTAHSPIFHSSAAGYVISGQLTGSRVENGNQGTTRTWATEIAVTFEVTSAPVQFTIFMHGNTHPASDNASLRITTIDNLQTLFNSADQDSTTLGSPPDSIWDDVFWTGTLNPGVYRLTGRADGHFSYFEGDVGQTGTGQLSFIATFTPSPGAATVLALGALLAGRRRRNG